MERDGRPWDGRGQEGTGVGDGMRCGGGIGRGVECVKARWCLRDALGAGVRVVVPR